LDLQGVSVRRNPPKGKGVPHSADYAAPKRKRQIKPNQVARLIRPTDFDYFHNVCGLALDLDAYQRANK
jgi:hypothetical protein